MNILTFYLVPLPRTSLTSPFRFALYTLENGEMKVVWPKNPQAPGKLWPYQVHTTRTTLPNFHFATSMVSAGEFAHELAHFHKQKVKLITLGGDIPSTNIAEYHPPKS